MAFGKKKPTAEQKLLQMIEAAQGGSALSSKNTQKISKKQNILTLLKLTNVVLGLGIVAVCVFLFAEIGSGIQLVSKDVKFKAPQDLQSGMAQVTGTGEVKPLAFYVNVLEQRNIFQPYENIEKQIAAMDDEQSRIKRMTRSLKLVGVSWLDRVETASVMIEDTEKQETYFLLKGEKIGDIVVKTIYADSALLGYENEEMILKYDKPQM